MEFSFLDEPICEVLTKVKKITTENPTKNIPNKVLHRFSDGSIDTDEEVSSKLLEIQKDSKVGVPTIISTNLTWKLSQDLLSEETQEMKKEKINQSILLNGFYF